ncbi:MAG: GAF domain-containing protein, partial [Actinomycetota bacterium]|nr:GAF domain-containing protein [Actinomycetota bacterium]
MGTKGDSAASYDAIERTSASLPVSASELAGWIGIPERALLQLAASGDIPAQGTSAGYRFEPQRIQEWLRTRLPRDSSPSADLMIVQELSRAVKNKEDSESVCAHLVDRLVDVLQAEAGAIFLGDPESLIRKVSTSGVEEAWQSRALEGLALWVTVTRQPLLLPSPSRSGVVDLDAEVVVPGGRDALAVPLLLSGRVLGALVLTRDAHVSPFTQRELTLVAILADQLALSLERDRVQELAQLRLQEAGHSQKQLEAYAIDVRRSFSAEKERRDQLADALSELERTYLATVEGLAVAVEAKDEYTAGHLYRVTEYGLAMMDVIAPDRASETQFRFGFLLH